MATAVASTSSIVSTSAVLGSSKSVVANRASPSKSAAGLPVLPRIVCSASSTTGKSSSNVSNAAASIAAAATTLVAAHPALALVDERLSGEGTGLSLGVNEPLVGWVLVIVPFILWGLFYNFTKELPNDEESGGLSL